MAIFVPKNGVKGIVINDFQIEMYSSQYSDGSVITLKEGYLDIKDNWPKVGSNDGLHYLATLNDDIEQVIAAGNKYEGQIELSEIGKKNILEKMLGFVRILGQ